MKCDKIKELLSAYLDEELSLREATLVRRHLEDCIDCQEELLEIDKVKKAIKELPSVKAPAELTGRIRDTIAQLDIAEEPITQSVLWRYRGVIRGFAAIAAAVLVVYVGTFLVPKSKEYERIETKETLAKDVKDSLNSVTRDLEAHKVLKDPGADKLGDADNKPSEQSKSLYMSNKKVDEKKDMESMEFCGEIELSKEARETVSGPVLFSQQLKITARNADDVVTSIKKIEAQYSKKQGGIEPLVNAPGGPSSASPAVISGLPDIMPTNKSKNNQEVLRTPRQRAGQPKPSQSIKKAPKECRVIIPVSQKEAFIEQLKLEKIGEVKTTELRGALDKQDSLTANQVLKEEIVNQYSMQLRKEINSLKSEEHQTQIEKGVVEGGGGSANNILADKKVERGEKKTGSLKEIDNSLIVIYDLKQQKEAEKQLSRGKSDNDAEDFLKGKKESISAGLITKQQELKKNITDGGLVYVELVIIIEEE